MQLDEYTRRKESLLRDLQRLQIIADDLNLKNQAKDLEQNVIQLGREYFELVVVGEFSRGKSTFINAMLGRRILPSSKKPTTTVISKIIYSETPSYRLVYKDGMSRVLDEKTFIKLTAPKEADEADQAGWKKYLHQKDDISKIDYAVVSYPLDFCKDNVEIIDTPGINDLNTDRVDITYRYLNKADAVIMVLAANQVLTASEMEFLRQRILSNQIADIFFVINFKDQASAQEEGEVINFARQNLQQLMDSADSPLRLYLVSSKQALVFRRLKNGENVPMSSLQWKPENLEITGFPVFEEALGHFLTEEKGNIKLKKYRRRALAGGELLAKDLRTRMEIAKHSVDEVRAKIAEMKPVLQKSQHEANQAVRQMETNLGRYKDEIRNICLSNGSHMRQAINRAVEDYDGEWNSKSISKAVSKVMGKEKMKLIDEIQAFEEENLKKEAGRTQQQLAAVWSDIDANYQKSFSLPALPEQENELEIDLSSVTSSNADGVIGAAAVGAVIGGIIGGAALLPVLAIAGGLACLFGLFGGHDDNGASSRERQKDSLKKDLHKHYDKEYREMTEKILEQYDKTVSSYGQNVRTEVDNRIEDMQKQLDEIMKLKNMKEQDAGREEKKLQQMLADVRAICDTMQAAR